MQIGIGGAAGDTWDRYKVQAPGGAAPSSVYDGAANLLKSSGAPGDWAAAVFAYNHSTVYVSQVLSQASSYYMQGLTAGSGTSTMTSSSGASGTVTTGRPFNVPAAPGDPAGPLALAQGQPAIVAATVFTDHTGAWGDNLAVNGDSFAERSPGVPGSQVTKHNATMLGGLPYLAPLRVTNPQNGRSVILYKRDIGAGQPLSHTLNGYHYRIDLTQTAEQQLGLSGSAIVQVTLLTGSLNEPWGSQACSASSPFAPAGAGSDPIPGFTIGRDDMGGRRERSGRLADLRARRQPARRGRAGLVWPPTATAIQVRGAAFGRADAVLVCGRADNPGDRHHRDDLPRTSGGRALCPLGHRNRNRLGIADIRSADAGRRDRSRRRQIHPPARPRAGVSSSSGSSAFTNDVSRPGNLRPPRQAGNRLAQRL
jgi:hypothetical protein